MSTAGLPRAPPPHEHPPKACCVDGECVLSFSLGASRDH